MKTHFIALLLLANSVAVAAPQCVDANLMPADKKAEAIAVGATWLQDAVYCDLGEFQVVVPKKPGLNAIMVLKNHRPFMLSETGFGINLLQEYTPGKSTPYLSVQDWDHKGIYSRLSYSLIDTSGNTVGNVLDKNMTGEPHITRYSQTK